MNATYIFYVNYSVSKVSRTSGVIFLLLCARYLREKFYLLKMTQHNAYFGNKYTFRLVRQETL